MMDRYLYQVFESRSATCWSYDAFSNRMVRLKGLNGLSRPDGLNVSDYDCDFFSRQLETYLANHNFIQPFPDKVKTVHRVGEEEYLKLLDGSCGRLTLELTQACNLRCLYCVYSGKFPEHRTHSDQHMAGETARKAIELFAQLSRRREAVSLCFYGGEALLCFEKIRELTAYARQCCHGRVFVQIASNGTLWEDSLFQWIADTPDVYLDVTLNGYGHDRYRRYMDGSPTLEDILRNVRRFQILFPDMAEERLNFICNAYTGQEVEELRQFYHEIGTVPALITGIQAPDRDPLFPVRNEENAEAFRRLRERYLESEDPFLCALFEPALLRIHHRSPAKAGGVMPLEGVCLPLLTNLYVSADGNIYLCEKTEHPSLGNVFTGVDRRSAAALMRDYAEALEGRCGNCWARRLCTVCYQDRRPGDAGPTEEACRNMRERLREDLMLYASVCEETPERLERFDHVEKAYFL